MLVASTGRFESHWNHVFWQFLHVVCLPILHLWLCWINWIYGLLGMQHRSKEVGTMLAIWKKPTKKPTPDLPANEQTDPHLIKIWHNSRQDLIRSIKIWLGMFFALYLFCSPLCDGCNRSFVTVFCNFLPQWQADLWCSTAVSTCNNLAAVERRNPGRD